MRIPGKLVIRNHAPARRYVLLGSTVLLGAVALYLSFELGHQKAGFDGIRAAQERSALQARIDAQDQAMRAMRVQLAAAETAQVAEVRERSELARTIGELQAGLARAQQDLEFYRAIANPGAAAKQAAVRVQQFRVLTTDAAARTYTLRFALARPTRPEESSAGTLGISIDGERSGSAASLGLEALGPDQLRELPYRFRYYTNMEQVVILPAGFKAERVTMEIRPAQKGSARFRQTFVWNPDAT